MNPSFSSKLYERIAAGAPFDDALLELREAGASAIDTIKAIREVKRTNLAEAKRLFTESHAWRDIVAAGDVLHEELMRSVENEHRA